MNKIAFVLSGGGAKGCYQAGVICALHDMGIKPTSLYGTSVGSLNAAGYAWNQEKIKDLWLSIKGKADVLKFNLKSILFLSTGLYSTKPLRELLQKNVKETSILAHACKVNLKNGKIEYGKSTDLDFIDSVQASSSIPGIMEPINGFVDGGVREMTPLKKAIEDGHDHIVVILCSPISEEAGIPPFEISNWAFNAYRAVNDIMEHEVYINDIKVCLSKNEIIGKKQIKISLYYPDNVFMDTLDFDPVKIRAGFEKGYQDGLKGPKPSK